MPDGTTPRISIVIPVYNEAAILRSAVVDLRERLAPLGWRYEIILAENGSKDRTVELAKELSQEFPEVDYVSAGEPNYGGALRKGIRLARGEFVLCDEIDLCDTDFHRRAVELLESNMFDMVIGSKLIAGAKDDRPWARHAASMFYTGLLRTPPRLQGNGYARPEGVQARASSSSTSKRCVVEKDVFASEFVIRAYRARTPYQGDPGEHQRKAPTVDQPL